MHDRRQPVNFRLPAWKIVVQDDFDFLSISNLNAFRAVRWDQALSVKYEIIMFRRIPFGLHLQDIGLGLEYFQIRVFALKTDGLWGAKVRDSEIESFAH